MEKNENTVVKDGTFIRGHDVFERMNFLYQLSQLWSVKNPDLAAYYAKTMISISKKSVLRLDSSIKKTVCKGCNAYLVEGATVRTSFKKSHKGQTLSICNRCGVRKRFPASKPSIHKEK